MTYFPPTYPATDGGTGNNSYTQGDLLYASSSTALSKLAKDTNSTRYLSNTGSSNNPAWAQVDLTNGVTGTLRVANGGNGWTTSAVSGSDATTTNKTATDVTGLSFACAANTLYLFRAVLVVTSSSAAGCKYAVQYSAAGASCGAIFSGAVTSTTGGITSVSALNSLDATAFLTSSQKSVVVIEGWLQTGANTGNLTIQHAKVTSGTSTVHIGSTLYVRTAGS